MTEAVLGLILIGFAGVLARYPGVTEWVSDHTNLVMAKFWSRHGYERPLEKYREATSLLCLVVPIFFFVMGVLFVLDAIFDLRY